MCFFTVFYFIFRVCELKSHCKHPKPIETQKTLFLAFIDFGFVDASFGFHPSPTYEWIFLSPPTHTSHVTHLIFIRQASSQLHKQKTGFRNGNEKITSIDVARRHPYMLAKASHWRTTVLSFYWSISRTSGVCVSLYGDCDCDVSRLNSLLSIDVVSCAFATLCSACSKLFLFINEKQKEMEDIRVRRRESENAIFFWFELNLKRKKM